MTKTISKRFAIAGKMLLISLLCMGMGHASFAQCCLTNSLIINTGYNPLTNLAVTPGVSGGTPVTDPHWKICAIDKDLTSDIGTSGFIPVAAGSQADVINPATGWAVYPGGSGGPGNWINSFNGSGYTQTLLYNYNWTVCRTFTLECDAKVTFYFPNITADNWITAGTVDATPIPTLAFSPYSGYGVYSGTIYVFGGNPGLFYTVSSFTLPLLAGTHTISFNLLNDNTSHNNIGFALQGYITTPSPSIVPENFRSCPTPTICPLTGPAICVGNTATLTDAVSGGTWSSSNTYVATVGTGSGIVTGVHTGVATITYTLPAGMGCPVLTDVTVNPAPVITGTLTPCAGTTTTLSATPGGGTWVSGNTTVAKIGSSSGVVTAITGGTSVITYTSPGGCTTTETLNVVVCQRPCADSSDLIIKSTSSATGGCTFTATATVATGNIILGYQWSGVGAAVIDHNHTGTDSYTFSLSPGTTAVITCTVYIVDTAFTDSTGPCCQVVMTQTVTCPGITPKECCFDSVGTNLTYTSLSSLSGSCSFDVTAHFSLLKGCKFIGYIWTRPGYTSGIVSWGSYTLPPIPPATVTYVTVTFIAIQPDGDTCKVTRSLTLDCIGRIRFPGDDAPDHGDGIGIFPNPTNNDVTITSTTEDINSIQVIDVNGKKVGNYSYDQHTRSTNVSLSQLPPGTYLFRVNNNVSKVVTKVN